MAEYKNAEGYADPTAFGAFCAIEKEEKALRAFRPIVYICSPYAGDVEGNTAARQTLQPFCGRGRIHSYRTAPAVSAVP